MSNVILEDIWKLRTDPFYPAVDGQGASIDPQALQHDLNPLLDERVLPCYFDVYDWQHSQLLHGLSERDAFDVFPDARTLPSKAAMMILVSGAMETGLDSFANLVLHKIKRIAGHDPLVVEVALDSLDKLRNVALVARSIVRSIRLAAARLPDGAALATAMDQEYERVHKEEAGRRDATYTEAFQAFTELLRPLKRQLVIKITAGGDSNSWERIYESSKQCCAWLLVMTSDTLHAKACHNVMTANARNFAWIKALPLDRAKAREYVVRRLGRERLQGLAAGAVAPTFPFSEDAIDALYEPGQAGSPGKPLAHPVGWLRRTLNGALIDQIATIRNLGAAPAPSVALDPTIVTIDAQKIRRAWERHIRK